ncbi:unnamed protein product, partial [Symbiodinium sp. CCMP2456]
DLDLNELGGTVSWTPPLVYTQQYVVYLAEDSSGTARSQVESPVAVGQPPGQWCRTNELLVPADTPRLNFTHFAVYTQTAFQEQTTPGSLAFDDAVAVVGTSEHLRSISVHQPTEPQRGIHGCIPRSMHVLHSNGSLGSFQMTAYDSEMSKHIWPQVQ